MSGRARKRVPLNPGDAVLYYPTLGGKGYRATVDSEPWLLGGHTEVVMLRDLEPAYGEDTGRPGISPRRAVTLVRRRRRSTLGKLRWIVEPEAVDDAVAAWHGTEPLHAAARRHGLTDGKLLLRLAAIGVHPPEGKGRAHWRVRTADVEQAVRVTPLWGYVRERRAA